MRERIFDEERFCHLLWSGAELMFRRESYGFYRLSELVFLLLDFLCPYHVFIYFTFPVTSSSIILIFPALSMHRAAQSYSPPKLPSLPNAHLLDIISVHHRVIALRIHDPGTHLNLACRRARRRRTPRTQS
jgi:hypothetical protein